MFICFFVFGSARSPVALARAKEESLAANPCSAVLVFSAGVISTEVGYCQGKVPNPTYEDVCSGQTGHVEVVQVVYDPDQVGAVVSVALFGFGVGVSLFGFGVGGYCFGFGVGGYRLWTTVHHSATASLFYKFSP
jgi:hypothetical protein